MRLVHACNISLKLSFRDLSGNQLSGSIPTSLGSLSQLAALYGLKGLKALRVICVASVFFLSLLVIRSPRLAPTGICLRMN